MYLGPGGVLGAVVRTSCLTSCSLRCQVLSRAWGLSGTRPGVLESPGVLKGCPTGVGGTVAELCSNVVFFVAPLW